MNRSKYSALKALSFSILLSAPALPALAQQTKNLSLNEAISLAVKSSGQLKIASAKVDEAAANTRQAKDNQLPDLKVSGSYLRLNSPDVALKVKLGSGSGGGGGVKVDQLGYAMANASLPIFSGFRVKYGIESAKYLEQAAKLDAESSKDEVVMNVVYAYSNLFKAQNTVDLVKENLQREVQRVTDFTDLEKNGIIARNDLLKAKLQESNIELTLLDAENNLIIATANMNLMLGLPMETALKTDNTILENNSTDAGLAQWEQNALKNRKDMEALTYKEKATETSIKMAKGEYYPGLAVTGGLIAADVPNLLTINNALNVGLGLQYNIATLWKTKAKVDGANARLHELQATKGIMNDQIRLQINQAYYNYLLATKKIEVYAKAIDQANENYRITKDKYDNKLATTTDLLDADVAQLQSQLNYSFSKVDAIVAYKKLQQAAGQLQ